MLLLRRFELHQPTSVHEASAMLRAFGPDGCLYAGGTELLLAMKLGVARYRHLVDVKTIPGLNLIHVRDGVIEIGAAVTHREVERSDLVRTHLPVVAEMEAHVANVRVRAVGTLAGNLCFAEPHSDPATLLSVLGARIVLEGSAGARELPIEDFLLGAYETARRHDEILTRIRIPILRPTQRATYVKFQIRERPMLSLALLLETPDQGKTITHARIAVGCVSARPVRSARAEALLQGPRQDVRERLLEAADLLADEANPRDDHEGSALYKRHLIAVFLRRSWERLWGG